MASSADETAGVAASLSDLSARELEMILSGLDLPAIAALECTSKGMRRLVQDAEPFWYGTTQALHNPSHAGKRQSRPDRQAVPILPPAPMGMPSWRAYLRFLHSQRVSMSATNSDIGDDGQCSETWTSMDPKVVVTCSGRVIDHGASDVASSSGSNPQPLLELAGADIPVRGIRQLNASNIEVQTMLACGAVTEGGELLLWDSCVMGSGGLSVIPPELFADRGGGAAHAWYLSDFKGHGVVASCYIDRLHTYAITKRGDLHIANHNDGGIVFPFVSFTRKHLDFKVKQVVTCSPAAVTKTAAVIVLALDTEGQLWTWGWADLEADDALPCYGLGRRPPDIQVDGYGHVTMISPQQLEAALEPGEVFSCVASGDRHFAACTSSGRMFCWGHNEHGQCGQLVPARGGAAKVSEPTLVPQLPGQPIVKVVAGLEHTIGLLSSGALVGFGSGAAGQLGPVVGFAGNCAGPPQHIPVPLALYRAWPQLGPAVDVCAANHTTVVVGASGRALRLGLHAGLGGVLVRHVQSGGRGLASGLGSGGLSSATGQGLRRKGTSLSETTAVLSLCLAGMPHSLQVVVCTTMSTYRAEMMMDVPGTAFVALRHSSRRGSPAQDHGGGPSKLPLLLEDPHIQRHFYPQLGPQDGAACRAKDSQHETEEGTRLCWGGPGLCLWCGSLAGGDSEAVVCRGAPFCSQEHADAGVLLMNSQ